MRRPSGFNVILILNSVHEVQQNKNDIPTQQHSLYIVYIFFFLYIFFISFCYRLIVSVIIVVSSYKPHTG